MQIVLDSNVLISALLIPKSNAGYILQLWRDKKFTLVVSKFILMKTKKVLCYPKIRNRLKWDEQKINHYVDLLSFFAKKVDIENTSAQVEKNQNDVPILATFIKAQVDYLVTGDDDLLSLANNYSIVTPAEFLIKLKQV